MTNEEADYNPVARDAEVDALHARIEALEAKCALLAASLKKADAHLVMAEDKLRLNHIVIASVARERDRTWNDAIDACQEHLEKVSQRWLGQAAANVAASALLTLRRKVPR